MGRRWWRNNTVTRIYVLPKENVESLVSVCEGEEGFQSLEVTDRRAGRERKCMQVVCVGCPGLIRTGSIYLSVPEHWPFNTGYTSSPFTSAFMALCKSHSGNTSLSGLLSPPFLFNTFILIQNSKRDGGREVVCGATCLKKTDWWSNRRKSGEKP